MVLKVQLKKCITNACIIDIVISELNYWLKLDLINWLEVNKCIEIKFYIAVLPLYLWSVCR